METNRGLIMVGKKITTLVAVLVLSVTIVMINGNHSSEVDATGRGLNLGTTLYVGGSGTGNYSSIQSAINAASNGDTVFVYNGTYSENLNVNKKINLIGENRNGTIIDGGGGNVIYTSIGDVNISRFTIRNGTYGLYLYYSSDNRIINNIISDNNDGILLYYHADNNTIENNIIQDNSNEGIEINQNCDYNIVANNTLCNNSGNGVLITHTNSNNTIENNIINNSNRGIYLYNSNTHNTIEGNTISNCSSYGVYLWTLNNNNKIFHNTIINNANQAYDDSTNQWNKSYPDGGNFWSDYSGGDLYRGPGQNISGNDGIGDASYNIAGGSNVDNYPLWPSWSAINYYNPVPGSRETCEYAMGSVKVAVIFLESNGTIDTETENWSSSRQSTVISEIRDALDWWELQETNASLNFSIENVGSKNTSYEPITHPHTNDSLWINETMGNMGYTSGNYLNRVQSYNNWLRANSTDWAYTIFVVDSYNDTDGNFSDPPWCAWAYWEYGCIVMTYDNGAWGIDRMNNVTAHESCHMFYATDEYNGQTEYNGYLNAADEEGSGCLMYNNNLCLSNGTKLQIGWRDNDSDGIMDILDTLPNTYLVPYEPDPTMNNTLSYTGYAVVVAYPNNNPSGSGRDVTLNTIANVQYRVDNGSWINATPCDGTFDEAVETFNFTTSTLSSGMHFIEARAINSVGNNDTTYANDTLYISELHDAKIRATSGAQYNITGNKWDALPDANVTWAGNVTVDLPSASASTWRNITLNITYDNSWGAPTNIIVNNGSGSLPTNWTVDSQNVKTGGTADNKYYIEVTIGYHVETGTGSAGSVNISVTFHSVAPSDPGTDGNGITFSLDCQSKYDTVLTGTDADSTIGDAIPEFSTLLIPVIGTIFLFFLMRRKYKK